MSNLTFPVIAVKGSAIELNESMDKLRTCTKRALKPGGWFDGGGPRLFDARGDEYRVRSARHARDTGRRAFFGLFAPTLVQVELELEHAGHRTVDEVRDVLAGAIRSDPEVWDASGSADRVLIALDGAASMDDVLGIMIPLLAPAR